MKRVAMVAAANVKRVISKQSMRHRLSSASPGGPCTLASLILDGTAPIMIVECIIKVDKIDIQEHAKEDIPRDDLALTDMAHLEVPYQETRGYIFADGIFGQQGMEKFNFHAITIISNLYIFKIVEKL